MGGSGWRQWSDGSVCHVPDVSAGGCPSASSVSMSIATVISLRRLRFGLGRVSARLIFFDQDAPQTQSSQQSVYGQPQPPQQPPQQQMMMHQQMPQMGMGQPAQPAFAAQGAYDAYGAQAQGALFLSSAPAPAVGSSCKENCLSPATSTALAHLSSRARSSCAELLLVPDLVRVPQAQWVPQ